MGRRGGGGREKDVVSRPTLVGPTVCRIGSVDVVFVQAFENDTEALPLYMYASWHIMY